MLTRASRLTPTAGPFTLALNTHMHEQSSTEVVYSYYLVNSHSYTVIERLWNYVQSTHDHMYMYKTRLASTHTAWIIQMPCDRLESLFLLQFASYVTRTSEPKFYQ